MKSRPFHSAYFPLPELLQIVDTDFHTVFWYQIPQVFLSQRSFPSQIRHSVTKIRHNSFQEIQSLRIRKQKRLHTGQTKKKYSVRGWMCMVQGKDSVNQRKMDTSAVSQCSIRLLVYIWLK
jgi:hypothetical protein